MRQTVMLAVAAAGTPDPPPVVTPDPPPLVRRVAALEARVAAPEAKFAAAAPPPAAAAPVPRSFVDPATGCTYTETAPGSGRYTRTSCPPRR